MFHGRFGKVLGGSREDFGRVRGRFRGVFERIFEFFATKLVGLTMILQTGVAFGESDMKHFRLKDLL